MLAPLSRLLLDLHPALLLLLLLDFLLLILLLALRGCGAAAARMLLHAATGGRSPQLQRARRRWQLCGSCGQPPPPCRSLFEDKASV